MNGKQTSPYLSQDVTDFAKNRLRLPMMVNTYIIHLYTSLNLNISRSWAVYHTIDSHVEVHHIIMLPIISREKESIEAYLLRKMI